MGSFGSPHFVCWCKMCLYYEWMELEAEIDNVVFKQHEPSLPTLNRESERLTDNCLLKPSPPNTSTVITTQRKKLLRTDLTYKRSAPTNQHQRLLVNACLQTKEAYYLKNNYHSTTRSFSKSFCTSPPNPTAKRQKKTSADLEKEKPPVCKRLHVSNIPFWFEDKELIKLFQGYGTILQAEVIYNERGSKGFGFVTFSNHVEATHILRMFDGLELFGRVIEVNYASKKTSKFNRPLHLSGTTMRSWNSQLSKTSYKKPHQQPTWRNGNICL